MRKSGYLFGWFMSVVCLSDVCLAQQAMHVRVENHTQRPVRLYYHTNPVHYARLSIQQTFKEVGPNQTIMDDQMLLLVGHVPFVAVPIYDALMQVGEDGTARLCHVNTALFWSRSQYPIDLYPSAQTTLSIDDSYFYPCVVRVDGAMSAP